MSETPHNLLTCCQTKSGQLECTICLSKLYSTHHERENFQAKWPYFLDSDPCNQDIYKLEDDHLFYLSEQLIPSKTDNRPPLLLVFGNPAPRSVQSRMFFSFEGNGKEHRFWKEILKPSGILDLSFNSNQSVEALNNQRRDCLLRLEYDSPFRIGLCVFISMPSAPGGKWGGVAGIQKLIGAKALRRLEAAERDKILECVKKFLIPDGAVITFQKNAWNRLSSHEDPPYSIGLAKAGKLKGKLKDNPDIPMFGIPPTRLIGPCRDVLHQVLLGFRGHL